MRKAYLLAYSDELGDREAVKGYLNAMSTVEKWRYDIPHAFYLVSAHSANEIADELRARTGSKGRFIVTEIPSNSNGWLTAQSWHLIQKLEYKQD